MPFQVSYGISDNPHAFWSIVNARRVIDYQPQDNSEIRFRELINKHIAAAGREREAESTKKAPELLGPVKYRR